MPLLKTETLGRPDDSPEEAYDHLKNELDLQILEMQRVLKVGGSVYFRSAGKRPWYCAR